MGIISVEISVNGCVVDTSACKSVIASTVGENEAYLKNEVVVYPNPAFNAIAIDLGDVVANEISIINVTNTVFL